MDQDPDRFLPKRATETRLISQKPEFLRTFRCLQKCRLLICHFHFTDKEKPIWIPVEVTKDFSWKKILIMRLLCFLENYFKIYK